MASKILYPPIVDNYMPAFVAAVKGDNNTQQNTNAYCRVYFSLSKFNSSSDFKSVHISVTKQGSGVSIVNKANNSETHRYRATGIIVPSTGSNVVKKVAENLFYVDILNEDIKDGWTAGWIYKIQLRLTSIEYPAIDANGAEVPLAMWLNDNANNFSEWSTVCIVKAIGSNSISIPAFNYSTGSSTNNSDVILSLSSLNITGTYSNTDISEKLYSYRMKLYQNKELIEDSEILYANQYINSNQFEYLFKSELEEKNDYTYELEYSTNNKYNGKVTINFQVSFQEMPSIDVVIHTAEDGIEGTSIYEEQEEGRIGLKLFSPSDASYSGNLCIRRTDKNSNFKKWEDIKIITMFNEGFNDLDIFYDYTAISGMEYKYAVQTIDETTEVRGSLIESDKTIVREYNYSYLLGENGQQLKLKFNNTLSNYKIAVSDSRTDTIGGKYPFITRNGNMRYKAFGINGLISFNMDENHLFLVDDFMGRSPVDFYDFTYEREFRDKVLEFLYNDRPKLFKSPTEGNVLVRLTDVQASPEQAIGRMIYSFSASAWEIDEATISNYIKYNLISIGALSSDYLIYNTEEKIGQLIGTFRCGDNLLELINQKYSTEPGTNILGVTSKVTQINNLKIHITSEPMGIDKDIYGWQLNAKNNSIIISHFNPIYVPGVDFYIGESITIGKVEDNCTFDAIIDFTYISEQKLAKTSSIQARVYTRGIGQIAGNYEAGASLYDEIYYKYYYNWGLQKRSIDTIYSIKIEANEGCAFHIQDAADENEGDIIVINETGYIYLKDLENIKNIVYKGILLPEQTGEPTADAADILVDYYYYLVEEKYKEVE